MKSYEILDEASDDLDAAAVWYEEQRQGLGLELVAEFSERLAFAAIDIVVHDSCVTGAEPCLCSIGGRRAL